MKPSESVQEKNWDGKGVVVCTVEVLFSNIVRQVSKFNLKLDVNQVSILTSAVSVCALSQYVS